MNWTKYWGECRAKLKAQFEELGITSCEIRRAGCWRDNALGFAHRHKRKWYLDKPELLGSFDQVLLACNWCHDQIEDDKELTEYYFTRLRDYEPRTTSVSGEAERETSTVPLEAFDIKGTDEN